VRISGTLAIPRVSRNNRLYLPKELELAVKRLEGKEIPVYWEHINAKNAIGKAKLFWNPEKLEVMYEAIITDPEAEQKIRSGIPFKVSLGADYERIDIIDGIEVPRNLFFREISLVAVPGIPEASVQVVEGAYVTESMIRIKERAVPFETTPKADEDRSWDKDRAIASLRKWASRDGSGEKDTIDWAKYKRGFAWYDEENPENFVPSARLRESGRREEFDDGRTQSCDELVAEDVVELPLQIAGRLDISYLEFLVGDIIERGVHENFLQLRSDVFN